MSALRVSFVRPATLRDLGSQLAALVSLFRRLFTKGRRSRQSGEDPGASYAGVRVPVKPIPPHHLMAAKEFPPSDKTHTFPKD
jgi:hypothetical protein